MIGKRRALLFFILLMPLIAAQEKASVEKHVILQIAYANGIFSLVDQHLVAGSAPKRLDELDAGLHVQVMDAKNQVVDSFFIGDPRIQHTERFFENGSIEGKTLELNETNFTVDIPFSNLTRQIRLSENGTVLLQTELEEALAFFCGLSDGVCDADCEQDADCLDASIPATPILGGERQSQPTLAGSPIPTFAGEGGQKTQSSAFARDVLWIFLSLSTFLALLLLLYGLTHPSKKLR